MAGYIGSKSSVTLVDGYTEAEADAEFVTKTGDTMSGNLDVTGTVTSDGLTVEASSAVIQSATGTSSPTPTTFNISTTSNASDWTTTSPWGRLAFYSGDTSGSGGKPHVVLDATASNAIGASSSFSVSTTSESSNTLSKRLNISNNGDISFYPAQKLTVASEGRLRLNRADNTRYGDIYVNNDSLNIETSNDPIKLSSISYTKFDVSGAERMRIDSSGKVLVGKTASGMTANGVELRTGVTNDYAFTATSLNQPVLLLNRQTDDGMIIRMRKGNSDVGTIGKAGSGFYIGGLTGSDFGVLFDGSGLISCTGAGVIRDNQYDMGHGGFRWNDIYATNGTIQTSDFNEKQDIASLTATEMLVGKRISALFKTFRWKDAVVEKGDNARTHTGVIAQDVQAAFTAEGLDAGDYALFTSFTWWEQEVEVPAVEAVAEVTDEDGNVTTEAVEAVDAYTDIEKYNTEAEAPEGATSKTRLGIRYPELLSFVAAYNEQRFASIEARLTALEA